MLDFLRYVAVQGLFTLAFYGACLGLFEQRTALLLAGALVAFVAAVHLIAFFFRMCGEAADWFAARKSVSLC